MTAMWEKLVLLLTQTLQVYQALLQLSSNKKEVLIAADPQALEKLTKQEEMLIIQAGRLEKLRQPLIGELAAGLGLETEQATLSGLIPHADSQTAGKLIELSKAFTSVTSDLARLNEINEKLIKQSLEFINYNINVLSQTTAESTYEQKGQTGPGKVGRSLLDAKV